MEPVNNTRMTFKIVVYSVQIFLPNLLGNVGLPTTNSKYPYDL